MKDAAMDTHCLIFSVYTVGTQLGQPDVEYIRTLCLMGTQGGRGKKKEWYKQSLESEFFIMNYSQINVNHPATTKRPYELPTLRW